MSVPASLVVSPRPAFNAGIRAAVLAALRRISWRVVGTTLAVMLALDAWLIIDITLADPPKPLSAQEYLSGMIINLLMAFSIMFTTLVADERVERGSRRLPAYTWAVVIGSAAAALAQWEVHQWLRLPTRNDVPGVPYEATITQPALVFFEYLIWGAIIVYFYVSRRHALRAATQMSAAQVERADAQRRTLESRLQALQARVEPQFLFDTLARVRELYESAPAKGNEMLRELIVYLRAALPQLRDTTSTLGQELDLVRPYLSIMRMHRDRPLDFEVDASRKELFARVPPMILLPIVDRLLVDSRRESSKGGTIRIASRSSDDALCVELSGVMNPVAGSFNESTRDIQERLHALYGDRGRLDLESSTSSGARIVMEIPYESTDSDHR